MGLLKTVNFRPFLYVYGIIPKQKTLKCKIDVQKCAPLQM